MRAVFVMLDNVLVNTISGRRSPINEDDWQLNVELAEKLKELSKTYYICIVLNNSLSFDGNKLNPKSTKIKVRNVIRVLEDTIKLNTEGLGCIGVGIRGDVFRTFPNPGSFYDLASDKEIYLKESYLIGSCDEEREGTINAGIGTYVDILDPYEMIIY